MTRLLLLVHGMGDHDDGWSDGAVQLLNDGKDAFGLESDDYAFTFGDESADVVVREVRYDDVFENFLARSARSAEELLKLADDEGVDLPVDDLWSWLASLDDEERKFFLTHVTDVLLFRYFLEVRKRVVETVITQIVEAIAAVQQAGAAPVQCSIAAHSLGTAVTQQTLHRLATMPLADDTVFMASSGWRFTSLAMIANVSRVLEREDVYSSIVGPPRRPGLPNAHYYVNQYLSFRHELDPFTLFRAFDRPLGAWGDYYVQPPDLQHYLAINVHGLEHYLEHPAVRLRLYNAVYATTAVTRAKYREVVDAYDPPPPAQCTTEMKRLSQRATAIIQRYRAEQNLTGFLKAAAEFLFLVKELEDDCPALAKGDLG